MGGDRLPVNDEVRTYEQVLGRVSALRFPSHVQSRPAWKVQLLSVLTQVRPESCLTRYLGLSYLYLYRIYKRMQLVLRRLMKAFR